MLTMKKFFANRVMNLISNVVMFSVAIVQLFDFVFTSISIQDFLGTGKTFQWLPQEAYAHVYDSRSPSQTNCYDNGDYHYQDALTKWGYRILEQIATEPKEYMWGSIGYFDSSKAPEMDMCGYFKGHYDNIKPKRARFMSTKEKLTLVKPFTLTMDPLRETWNPQDTSLHEMDEALEHGYYGSRRAIEIRMTARLDFPSIDAKQKESNGTWVGYYETIKPVKAVRFYAKSFCDGCQPIAELGQMFCELECKVTAGKDAGLINVEVHSAHRRAHSKHRMGVSFPSTQSAFVETIIRFFTLVYVAHLMLNILSNSIKSNEERYYLYKKQGANATVLRSDLVDLPFLQELTIPGQNVCRTQSFSLSFVMYNSDVIVFGNLIVVALTFMTSMQLKHEVVWWAYRHETFRAVITRIGVNAKMMWLYLALIKFYKMLFAKFGKPQWTEKMCFHSHLFVWFWVVYLIFLTSSGFDFLLDPFFEDRLDVINNFVVANDISVTFMNGFYFIRLPAIFFHSIIVSVIALLALIFLQARSGLLNTDTTLYRQMACGSSMLIIDPEILFDDATPKTALITIGSLMNLKWFMKTHCMKYRFLDEQYGIFRRGDAFEKKEINSSGADSSNLTDCIAMVGESGSTHIILQSTKQELEEAALFHQWLKTGSVIRIH